MAFSVNAAEAMSVGAILWHHEAGSWRTVFAIILLSVRAAALAALAQAYRTVFVAEATREKWLPMRMRANFDVAHHAQAPDRIAANAMRWTREGARSQLAIDEEEICVLLLGSICARKGQIDLLRAAAALPKDLCAKARFLIVGPIVQQRYGRRFERELETLPASVRSRIEVIGGVEDVALYYRAADVFVCCSRAESAPRVLQEAMSFRLPIITTMVDGIPELMGSPPNALTYEPSDIAGLAAHLSALIDGTQEHAEWGARAEQQLARLPEL